MPTFLDDSNNVFCLMTASFDPLTFKPDLSATNIYRCVEFCDYCRTWNVRVHEMFANFAKSADSRTFHAREYYGKGVTRGRGTVFKISRLLMLRFWQIMACFKAEKVYFLKIRENFMHANCLWPKFANSSCRENFMFYSIQNHEVIDWISETTRGCTS